MGEVYQATNTRLKRPVAIKVLPEALASDAERLAQNDVQTDVLALQLAEGRIVNDRNHWRQHADESATR